MSQNSQAVIAYKGFNHDLSCRGYKFEVGGTYQHAGEVKTCSSGFHACEYPLDVWSYYAPVNRFAVVECSGELSRHEGDTKVAAARLTVKAELKIPELVDHAVRWILARINKVAAADEDQSIVSETGDYSAATNTGSCSAATNTGDYSAATNTGSCSAATNTGHRSAATNTGHYSAASVEGDHSVAAATGFQGRAMAAEGSAIVIVNRDPDTGAIMHIRAAVAGREIKPGIWYMLDEHGEFMEVA